MNDYFCFIEDNQKEFQEYGGMDLFVGYLTNTEDEDVSNAIKYILSTAVKKSRYPKDEMI